MYVKVRASQSVLRHSVKEKEIRPGRTDGCPSTSKVGTVFSAAIQGGTATHYQQGAHNKATKTSLSQEQHHGVINHVFTLRARARARAHTHTHTHAYIMYLPMNT